MSANGSSSAPPSAAAPSERAAPWYLSADEIENSPSRQYFVKKYGSVERARNREQESRLTTCAFLQESGQKLRLPQLSIATAIVFYHRFYARESYETYERFQVATTCLFLASKVEETPKKLKDVIIESYKVQHNTVQPPDPDSQELWKLKEQILICERELLRVLGFDLSVEHAYRPLLAYIKSISGTRDLAQIAWNFINDSLRTTLCLQYAPRCLAAATVMMASSYLEAKLGKPCSLPNHPPGTEGKWFTAFQVKEETIHDIVRQIHDMYESNKGGSVHLANSSAVAKMKASMDLKGALGGGKAKAAADAPLPPREANISSSSGRGGDTKPRSSAGREVGDRVRTFDRDGSSQPTGVGIKRDSSSGSSGGGGGGSNGGSGGSGRAVAAGVKKEDSKKEHEEGEIEEGEVAPQSVKRQREE